MTEELKQETNSIPTAGPVAETSTDAVLDGAKKPIKGKKRVKKAVAVRQVASGRAYVKSTYNNTIVTLTDQNGNVLSWSSAGQCGFKGPKKATPYAASVIVKDAAEKVKKYGLKEVSVFVRGIGGGREAAVRALNANGFNVVNIKDITPIPHNGCRPPRPRRV
jgi:small subunit ribosomal protein S11